MGYDIITRQGYKGLGLGIHEHGIKLHVHIPPRNPQRGPGYISPSNTPFRPPRPCLHLLLPTTTSSPSNTQEALA